MGIDSCILNELMGNIERLLYLIVDCCMMLFSLIYGFVVSLLGIVSYIYTQFTFISKGDQNQLCTQWYHKGISSCETPECSNLSVTVRRLCNLVFRMLPLLSFSSFILQKKKLRSQCKIVLTFQRSIADFKIHANELFIHDLIIIHTCNENLRYGPVLHFQSSFACLLDLYSETVAKYRPYKYHLPYKLLNWKRQYRNFTLLQKSNNLKSDENIN